MDSIPKESNIDKLWDAAFLLNFTNSNGRTTSSSITRAVGSSGLVRATASTTFSTGSPLNMQRLKRLSELGDTDALLSMVVVAVRNYQSVNSLRQSMLASGQVTAMPAVPNMNGSSAARQPDLLKQVHSHPSLVQNEQVLLLSCYTAIELQKSGRNEELKLLLPTIQTQVAKAPKLPYATAMATLEPNRRLICLWLRSSKRRRPLP